MIKVTMSELKTIMRDPGFRININGNTYKIGAHRLVYRWSLVYKEWIRSMVEISDLRVALRDKVRRKRKRAES